jgi:hypothetical protein
MPTKATKSSTSSSTGGRYQILWPRIKEAAELQGGVVFDFDLAKGRFSIHTEEQHRLDIFIQGGRKSDDEATKTVKTEVEAHEVVVKQELVEVLDSSTEEETEVMHEVVELLDTSGEATDAEEIDSES